MNAQRTPAQFPQSASNDRNAFAATTSGPRINHRQRDFGVGYGNSSGYASSRRYASQTSERMFRCV